MKQQVLRLLSIYQDYRALRPAACRFQPTCSTYAYQAIDQRGVASGSWLAFRRLTRCHPLGGHGHDPVPERLAPDGSVSPAADSPASLLRTHSV